MELLHLIAVLILQNRVHLYIFYIWFIDRLINGNVNQKKLSDVLVCLCWFGISFYHQRFKVHHWRQASEPPVEPTDAAGSDVKE